MTIRISALIPTFNRASYLRKSIQSLVHQTLPKDQYEIIVIDNSSTDETQQLVLSEFAHVRNLRYCCEPELGLNMARNTGWRSATGEYLAYLDDDAIACPEWLEKILNRFENYRPKPGCVGGRITPIWESPRPRWLTDSLATYLAILNSSDSLVVSSSRQVLAGANMAVRRDLLETLGGFGSGLGRRGHNLISNEDILFQLQVMRRGYPCLYDPQISVQHHIQASRLNKDWFAKRMYWEGVSESMMENLLNPIPFWQRLRTTQYRLRKILFSPRRLSELLARTNDPELFARKCFTWREVGYCFGLLKLAA